MVGGDQRGPGGTDPARRRSVRPGMEQTQRGGGRSGPGWSTPGAAAISAAQVEQIQRGGGRSGPEGRGVYYL